MLQAEMLKAGTSVFFIRVCLLSIIQLLPGDHSYCRITVTVQSIVKFLAAKIDGQNFWRVKLTSYTNANNSALSNSDIKFRIVEIIVKICSQIIGQIPAFAQKFSFSKVFHLNQP